jgi:hypothetical protein
LDEGSIVIFKGSQFKGSEYNNPNQKWIELAFTTMKKGVDLILPPEKREMQLNEIHF